VSRIEAWQNGVRPVRPGLARYRAPTAGLRAFAGPGN